MIKIELSAREAVVLNQILMNIGGSPTETMRREVDSILDKIGDVVGCVEDEYTSYNMIQRLVDQSESDVCFDDYHPYYMVAMSPELEQVVQQVEELIDGV